ncbi:hypothetical protein BR93DRAFT_691040 [Coniochaeta sp. PMI_546]|nr:hypothetical protein BR93DRAFT_691040 [Coniochaeta sp. PMI_546]
MCASISRPTSFALLIPSVYFECVFCSFYIIRTDEHRHDILRIRMMAERCALRRQPEENTRL